MAQDAGGRQASTASCRAPQGSAAPPPRRGRGRRRSGAASGDLAPWSSACSFLVPQQRRHDLASDIGAVLAADAVEHVESPTSGDRNPPIRRDLMPVRECPDICPRPPSYPPHPP